MKTSHVVLIYWLWSRKVLPIEPKLYELLVEQCLFKIYTFTSNFNLFAK